MMFQSGKHQVQASFLKRFSRFKALCLLPVYIQTSRLRKDKRSARVPDSPRYHACFHLNIQPSCVSVLGCVSVACLLLIYFINLFFLVGVKCFLFVLSKLFVIQKNTIQIYFRRCKNMSLMLSWRIKLVLLKHFVMSDIGVIGINSSLTCKWLCSFRIKTLFFILFHLTPQITSKEFKTHSVSLSFYYIY